MTHAAQAADERHQQADGQEHRLIVAGFGGQGILTLGKLLCMAAMREGKKVTYLPAYGPEVRGGTANCQVVISSETIYSPLVEQADSAIILNQLSYERFARALRPAGLLLVNSSGVDTDAVSPAANARVVRLPAAEIAADMGDVRVANVIMLGAFVRVTALVAEQTCATALADLLGRRKAALIQLNEQAFIRGGQLAEGA